MQLAEPAVLNVSGGQAVQTDDELLPFDGLYVNAGHAIQAEDVLLPVEGV